MGFFSAVFKLDLLLFQRSHFTCQLVHFVFDLLLFLGLACLQNDDLIVLLAYLFVVVELGLGQQHLVICSTAVLQQQLVDLPDVDLKVISLASLLWVWVILQVARNVAKSLDEAHAVDKETPVDALNLV